MFCFGIFGPEFEKVIIIFEINALELAYLQNFVKKKKKPKQKCLNLRSKVPYLGISGLDLIKPLSYLKSKF